MDNKIKMEFGSFYIQLLNSCKKVSGRVFEYGGERFGVEKQGKQYALSYIKTGALIKKYDTLTDIKNDIRRILRTVRQVDKDEIRASAKRLESFLFKVYAGEIDENTGEYIKKAV